MDPRHITPSITYDGKDISESLAPYLISISYTDNLSGYADDLEITLEDREGLWTSDWFPDRGATLDLTLTTTNWKDLSSGKETLHVGLFSIDTIEGRMPPSEVTLKAVSVPDNAELRGVDRTRSWEKAELKTIANDVASGGGLTLVYDCEENPVIDRVEQTEQSDLSFLLKLCEDHGLALKICNEQIVIFDESQYEAVAPIIHIVKPGTEYTPADGEIYATSIIGYSFHAVTRDIYKACHVKYVDTDKGETIEATFTDPSKGEGKTLEVNEQVATVADAEKLAKKKLREQNKDEWTMTFDLMGNMALLASMTVSVEGFGKFDGNYLITTAKHDIGSGYTTSIDLRRCLDGY